MRIFALSDIHVDYAENRAWVQALSTADYRDDTLILAGDVSDSLSRLAECLQAFSQRFARVLFVPGNHDVWVLRDAPALDSLAKFHRVMEVAAQSGAVTTACDVGAVRVVPLQGWYDQSFGVHSDELQERWMDYRACRWPDGVTGDEQVSHLFDAMNHHHAPDGARPIISFSHFLPRVDVMPAQIPQDRRWFWSVLGSRALERQVRRLGSHLHVYGHSHVNQRIEIEGVTYVNNAFGYPRETRIAAKALTCIHEE